MTQRLLITGASGFLGRQVALHLKDQYEVVGTYHEHVVALDGCDTRQLDVADGEQVASFCRAWQPTAIVHTAAQSDVDGCERHPELAVRVNVQGAVNVARAATEVGARLIHISTDQLYDGVKGSYDERDEPRPLMAYGRTKLAGEQQAAAACDDMVTLRLALLYGWGHATRPTFIDWMFARLQAGHEVPLFVDQYRTPLYVGQAAEVIGRLLAMRDVRGVFNLGGGERLDRYAFGRKFCEVFQLSHRLLKPVRMATVSTTVARPPDCSLNSAKISALLGIRLLTVDEGLRAMPWPGGS